jgi:hypothetical protein
MKPQAENVILVLNIETYNWSLTTDLIQQRLPQTLAANIKLKLQT